MKKSLLAIAVAAIITGCGGSSNDNNGNVPVSPAPNVAPVSSDVVFDISQSVRLTGKLEGSDSGAVSFSLADPSEIEHGKLEIIDASTGEFTYITNKFEGQEVATFRVSDGELESTSTITINISGEGDPLVEHQWHLENTGQSAFAANRGVAGEDMNVTEAIADGVKGQGILVGVVDDGVEIAHPDLAGNVVPGGSYNLITGTVDPTPFSDGASHGTSVAGIIAAEGWNNIGGRGVAPQASIVGYNFLDSDPSGLESAQSAENWLHSHGATSYSDRVRVFNQSYGYSLPFPDLIDEDEFEVYHQMSTESFNGNGMIFVKSAGNGYNFFRAGRFAWLPGDYFRATEGNPANHGMPFHNSHMSTDNGNVYNLVVSAINAEGKLSSYSSVGSNVFVTAPGGEFGVDSPAIVTTDRVSCDKGSNVINDRPATPFHGDLHPLNDNCDYRSTMNGTSSAAPNTTGAVAMILSANPQLSWRDVRYILASTSTKIESKFKARTVTIGESNSAVEYEAIPSWTENAAGFSFHNFYGFGRVDVSAAVKAAQSYDIDLGEYKVSEWIKSEELNKNIPDGNISGTSDVINVTDNMTVESVQIQVSADHLRLPDLAVEVISPAGTRSVLLMPYNGYTYQGVMDPSDPRDFVPGFEDTMFMSNAFYGESSLGDWTIRLIDVNSGEHSMYLHPIGEFDMANEDSGKLKGWSLRFHGGNTNVAQAQ